MQATSWRFRAMKMGSPAPRNSSQALFFALAVRFDQAHLVRKLIQRIPQRFADRLILRQIEHRRLAIAPERHGAEEGQGTNLLIP